MNLIKLFEAQKVLRDRIAYNEPDRFNKLVLSLLVELGECANEQRSWKFWSKDQQPRNFRVLSPKYPSGGNPLLEEYVDVLHFVLELGLEDKVICRKDKNYTPYKVLDGEISNFNTEIQFINIFIAVQNFWIHRDLEQTIEMCLGLGEMLGFTWEQIEQAYFSKNKVNHERQDNGY